MHSGVVSRTTGVAETRSLLLIL